jgi:DnaJ-class molecular chaperone
MPMDDVSDPYLELGVPRAASKADITNAYHRLVRQYHPDSRQGAYSAASDTALIRVLAAYAILKNQDSRDRYDQQHPEPIPHAHPRSSLPRNWLGSGHPHGLRVTPVRWH